MGSAQLQRRELGQLGGCGGPSRRGGPTGTLDRAPPNPRGEADDAGDGAPLRRVVRGVGGSGEVDPAVRRSLTADLVGGAARRAAGGELLSGAAWAGTELGPGAMPGAAASTCEGE